MKIKSLIIDDSLFIQNLLQDEIETNVQNAERQYEAAQTKFDVAATEFLRRFMIDVNAALQRQPDARNLHDPHVRLADARRRGGVE